MTSTFVSLYAVEGSILPRTSETNGDGLTEDAHSPVSRSRNEMLCDALLTAERANDETIQKITKKISERTAKAIRSMKR